MSDTYTLHLENFRSIRDAKVEIAPLTVIYGANGSGKSSLIYGLLTLRNFFTNPAQNIPSLFSYPTISLGGLREVVRDHNEDASVLLSLGVRSETWSSRAALSVGQSGGITGVEFVFHDSVTEPTTITLEIPFPYHGEQQTSALYSVPLAAADGQMDELQIEMTWNGISVGTGQDHFVPRGVKEELPGYLIAANSPVELTRGVGFVPLRRGFTTPVYGVSNVSPYLATDIEVASLLATEPYLEYSVSAYLEAIASRQLRVRTQVGTSSFHLHSVPRDGDTPVAMVNEGFGINQLVHMLTVCLYDEDEDCYYRRARDTSPPLNDQETSSRHGGHHVRERQAHYRVHSQRDLCAGPTCSNR